MRRPTRATENLREKHDNDTYYQPAGGPTPTSTPWTAQLVPPDAELPGLHPQVDVFEETASPADEHAGTKDWPQDSGIGEQTEADFSTRGRSWTGPRQPRRDRGQPRGQRAAGRNMGFAKTGGALWAPTNPAPKQPAETEGTANKAARVARNRQDRAEWRERRRLRRRMGLEAGLSV